MTDDMERSTDTSQPSTYGWSYRPRLDLVEGPDEFTVLADMPGSTAEDIRVTFAHGTMAIHAAIASRQTGDTEYLRHEYGVGDFDREYAISEAVDADRISAEYEHGVLTVHLPKSDEAKPRRIHVRSA